MSKWTRLFVKKKFRKNSDKMLKKSGIFLFASNLNEKLVLVASMDFWNIQKNKSGFIVVDLLFNHFTSGSKKSVTKSNYWPIYIMVHNGEYQPMDRFNYRHFWTGHYKNVQIETLRNENSYFLNSNTCSCSRLLGISSVLGPN